MALRPKAWALLRYLAERPGALVTKDELQAAVWGDTVVSDDTLTQTLGELRRALRDDAKAPRVIETVHRRGFRFEAHVQTLAAQAPAPAGPSPAARTKKKPRDNEPRFDIRTPLHQLTGVDLTQLDAIGLFTALRLLAEIGTDMRRWPPEKHFTSWLTLAPDNNISGGRLLSSKTQPSASRAAGILRMAAMSLGGTETALGAFYRRLAYRVGKAKASRRRPASSRSSSTARSRMVWGLEYQDPGAAAYDAQHRTRVIRRLRQRAANLGSHSSITKAAR